MSPGLTPRKSIPAQTTSRTLPLIFFHFALRSLCRPISKHATRNAQHDGGGSEVLGINVKLITMYSYYHCRFVSICSRNYNLTKIVTRRQLNGLRSESQSSPVLVSQGTYLARAVPFWDASCATFFHGAPKLRELREGIGARRGCFDGRGSR